MWLFYIQGIFQVDVVASELVVNDNKSILYSKKASQSQGGVFGDVVVKAEAACSLFIYYPIVKIHGKPSPKGRSIQDLCKSIQGNCAIYLYSGVQNSGVTYLISISPSNQIH